MAEDRASAAPEVAEDRLGYSTIQLAIPAATAAAYLIDLLHMRSFKFSPMSASTPDDFLKACQGMSAVALQKMLVAPTCNTPPQGMHNLQCSCCVSTLQELNLLVWKPLSLHNHAEQMALLEHQVKAKTGFVSVRLQVAYGCAGCSLSCTPALTESADRFEWCGGFYSWTDLRGALSVVCTAPPCHRPDSSQTGTMPDQPLTQQQDGQVHGDSSGNEPSSVGNAPEDQASSIPHAASGQNLLAIPTLALDHRDSLLQSSFIQDESQDQDPAWGEGEPDQQISLAEQYNDPWLPSSWGLLGGAAQNLLDGLAEAESIPWVCAASVIAVL